MKSAQVTVVVGTRPEAIKLAPLILALRRQPRLSPIVVTTGQHTRVVTEVLDAFGIAATADLAAAEAGPHLDAVAAAVMSRLAALLREQPPDAVVVQGDTTSVLAASLAAFYQKIPVAHLEAGLRSHDKQAPFPEEVHRRVATVLADLHFAPTPAAADRLLAEGVAPAAVHMTGNTVVDALTLIRDRQTSFRDVRLTRLTPDRRAPGRRLVLVTAHRRESWGQPLRQIVRAIAELATACPQADIVFVMHPNPALRETFRPLVPLRNVLLTEPEPYGSFVRLLGLADLVLTDSGGIQEEAATLGVPALVLRDTTERSEGIWSGVAKLVGTDAEHIAAVATGLLRDPAALAAMASPGRLYGDARAASRCVTALAGHIGVPVD